MADTPDRRYSPRMRRAGTAALTGLILAAAVSALPAGTLKGPAPGAAAAVKLGVEVLFEKHLDLVKGKRVGLITNPTGADSRLRSTVDLLLAQPDVHLAALYGPEHGVRGDAQAGAYVPYYFDEKTKLPVFSLYGQSMKPEPGMLKNIDAFMRSFDTQSTGKKPEVGMVKDIDVMIFDIQDVGTRVYTYIATMALAMQACAESGIPFVVLDRPDPINGLNVEGPMLEYPKYSSYVGFYPVPERYGMTMGELARMFNEKYLKPKARLTVVPMEGWTRGMWFDQTGLPWITPSPNMPTLETAEVYPGQVYFEGTNVSEGRGTTRPFEVFGAPWIDGGALAARLNALGLAGAAFRETWFTPTFSKFQDKLCGGCQVHVLDRTSFRSFETVLHIIKTIRAMYPAKFEFHKDYFDKIMGTAKVREALESGAEVAAIMKGLEAGLADFERARRPYLLY